MQLKILMNNTAICPFTGLDIIHYPDPDIESCVLNGGLCLYVFVTGGRILSFFLSGKITEEGFNDFTNALLKIESDFAKGQRNFVEIMDFSGVDFSGDHGAFSVKTAVGKLEGIPSGKTLKDSKNMASCLYAIEDIDE